MEFTAENIRQAGGIRHLCYYYASIGGTIDKWNDVEVYIRREWRGISDDEVTKLLEMCIKAHHHASLCNLEVPS